MALCHPPQGCNLILLNRKPRIFTPYYIIAREGASEASELSEKSDRSDESDESDWSDKSEGSEGPEGSEGRGGGGVLPKYYYICGIIIKLP